MLGRRLRRLESEVEKLNTRITSLQDTLDELLKDLKDDEEPKDPEVGDTNWEELVKKCKERIPTFPNPRPMYPMYPPWTAPDTTPYDPWYHPTWPNRLPEVIC